MPPDQTTSTPPELRRARRALAIAVPRWLGVELDEVRPAEKLISALGGTLGVLVVWLVCEQVVGTGTPLVVASMGSSAVLLFAVPHGQLSQPWPLLAGHLTAAAIGVACTGLLGVTPLAGALAVGTSIGVMHALKAIHPPAGATALTAVIGGTAVTDLGFRFVLTPIALNAALLLVLAVAFNNLFPWRRYPAVLLASGRGTGSASDEISHQAVVAALRELDSFIDITEEDLLRLHRLIGRIEASAPEREDPPTGDHPS